ncbi:MAG: ankyrin repeat domain-containing protein [Planctomycetota bacterium]
MATLPPRPDLDQLKRQARELLRRYRAGDPAAFARFRAALPAARTRGDEQLRAMNLRLHDAQSCLAREHGFSSWADLGRYVAARQTDDRHLLHRWLALVYGVAADAPRPALAARVLAEFGATLGGGPLVHCAVGDAAAIGAAIAADPGWVHRPIVWTCPVCRDVVDRPPLLAVALSGLLREPAFAAGLRESARLLLAAGADVNRRWQSGSAQLSALYGAAGQNHDPQLTAALLAAGADPDDGESLYHAMATRDARCAELLLDAGARFERTNALHHKLDFDDLDGLRLLLARGADPNDTSTGLPPALFWAVRRGRSLGHVRALLAAGADPRAMLHGVSLFRYALLSGRADVAALLRQAGAGEELSLEDEFVATCARGDTPAAQAMLRDHPDLLRRLAPEHLAQLPALAAAGVLPGVRTMVEVGWPIAVRGGDWQASALNLAVFRGDAEMTRLLLAHGASWDERHGHGDNVNGTLEWASRNHDPDAGDWIGCAAALLDHGMPNDPARTGYSPEVAEFMAQRRRPDD